MNAPLPNLLPNVRTLMATMVLPELAEAAQDADVWRARVELTIDALFAVARFQYTITETFSAAEGQEREQLAEELRNKLSLVEACLLLLDDAGYPRTFRRELVAHAPQLVKRYDEAQSTAVAKLLDVRLALRFLLEEQDDEIERELRPVHRPLMPAQHGVTFDLG